MWNFVIFNFAPNPDLPTFRYGFTFHTDAKSLLITNISNVVYNLPLVLKRGQIILLCVAVLAAYW